jgi:hypothetical protein
MLTSMTSRSFVISHDLCGSSCRPERHAKLMTFPCRVRPTAGRGELRLAIWTRLSPPRETSSPVLIVVMSAISASISSHLRPRHDSHARVPPRNRLMGGDAGTSALIGASRATLAQKPAPLVATDEIGSPDKTPDNRKLRVRRVRGAGERATEDNTPISDGTQHESYLRRLLHKRKRSRISAANVEVGVGRRLEHTVRARHDGRGWTTH